MLGRSRGGPLTGQDLSVGAGVWVCFRELAVLGAYVLRPLPGQRFEIGGGVGCVLTVIRCPGMPGCDSRGFGCRLGR